MKAVVDAHQFTFDQQGVRYGYMGVEWGQLNKNRSVIETCSKQIGGVITRVSEQVAILKRCSTERCGAGDLSRELEELISGLRIIARCKPNRDAIAPLMLLIESEQVGASALFKSPAFLSEVLSLNSRLTKYDNLRSSLLQQSREYLNSSRQEKGALVESLELATTLYEQTAERRWLDQAVAIALEVSVVTPLSPYEKTQLSWQLLILGHYTGNLKYRDVGNY